ncbi:MAG TPA: hypothetical protein VGO93_26975 [Candidatus Xenobia bacterium]
MATNTIAFGNTKPVASPKLTAGGTAVIARQDGLGSSVEESPKEARLGHMGLKLGAAALGGIALIGGLAGCSGPPSGVPVQACETDPYAAQDLSLLNHMSTLFASPTTGYNHAAGLYDGNASVFNRASELNRMDGTQALQQLQCGQPVRLYSPQTGWLKFHNLNQLHHYVGEVGQPWDMPNVYLGSSYLAGPNSPYYDSEYYQYNNYNSYMNGFYAGLSTPSWTYSAPPTYTPTSDWSQAPTDWNQAPPSSGGNWNQGGGSWNQAPPDNNNQAPVDNGGGSWNQAPSQQAPVDNGGGSWNQAPPSNGGGSWNQAPSPSQAPADNGGGSWNQAPAASGGGSWNQAPAGGGSQAPADWN